MNKIIKLFSIILSVLLIFGIFGIVTPVVAQATESGSETITTDETIVQPLEYTGKWRVDLSYMKPCSKNDKVLLYSADGRSDNDIIVAEYANNLYFLSSGDILDPYNYTVADFSFELWEEYSEKYESITFEELWYAHLNLEDMPNASTGESPGIRMRLKNKPELIYSFSFNVNEGRLYHHSTPFEPTIVE